MFESSTEQTYETASDQKADGIDKAISTRVHRKKQKRFISTDGDPNLIMSRLGFRVNRVICIRYPLLILQ